MQKRQTNGFTLIEGVIVVMVLGILTLIGLPMMNSAVDDVRLTGASDEVVMAFTFAQTAALNGGLTHRVTINATTDSILVERSTPNADLVGGASELAEAAVEAETFSAVPHPLRSGGTYSVAFPSEDRLEQVLRKQADAPCQASAQAVFSAVDTFRQGAQQRDDETILIVDRL